MWQFLREEKGIKLMKTILQDLLSLEFLCYLISWETFQKNVISWILSRENIQVFRYIYRIGPMFSDNMQFWSIF